MQHFFSILFAVVLIAVAIVVVLQGDIAQSLSRFGGWAKQIAWPKVRALRHIRRLINVPFHIYMHVKTRDIPLCLGQVWVVGLNKTIRVIGKASNGDWVLQLSDDIQGVMTALHFRERIYDEGMYLYEWDQSINYIPTIDSIHGLPVIVLKRHYPF